MCTNKLVLFNTPLQTCIKRQGHGVALNSIVRTILLLNAYKGARGKESMEVYYKNCCRGYIFDAADKEVMYQLKDIPSKGENMKYFKYLDRYKINIVLYWVGAVRNL